ncbi:cytochrome b/b6 domain-containing protein [Breoghania sp.]|uniref:cytochrome b/b6 domain-containing protein n=1 Tax=Breoghania sp. TaxID=2065378 RepID=UPI002AA763BE|nr:cytochrome b/b6 domain-containing protein [Breoghania sp.]
MTDHTFEGETGGAVAPPDPWDPLVRITHWLVAAAVLVNGLIDKPGGITHVWIGWAVLAVLATRMAWGFIGPAEARFSSFPPSPRAALAHVRDLHRGRPKEHRSHNPAGTIMVYALWASLAVVVVTGLVMTDARSPVTIAEEKIAVASGDWSALAAASKKDEDHGLKDVAEEVHGAFANLLLILAAFHVGGVVVESRALRRNLLRPMLYGKHKA